MSILQKYTHFIKILTKYNTFSGPFDINVNFSTSHKPKFYKGFPFFWYKIFIHTPVVEKIYEFTLSFPFTPCMCKYGKNFTGTVSGDLLELN